MFDLFGRRRKAALFDRAYAEFVSGNTNLAIKFLTDLINEKTNDYKVYNLRGACFIKTGYNCGAFNDFKSSINLEPNINKNYQGYDGRNLILENLKNGNIKANLLELSKYFSVNNTLQLIEETYIAGIEVFRENYPNNINSDLLLRLKYLAFDYIKYRSIKHNPKIQPFSTSTYYDYTYYDRSNFVASIDGVLDKTLAAIHKGNYSHISSFDKLHNIPPKDSLDYIGSSYEYWRERGSISENSGDKVRRFVFAKFNEDNSVALVDSEDFCDEDFVKRYLLQPENQSESAQKRIKEKQLIQIERVRKKNRCLEEYYIFLDDFFEKAAI